MVEDLNPTGDSNVARFMALGSIVLFVADDGVLGPELHRSDGTVAGTFLVEEIVAGPGGISVTDDGFAVLGSALIFSLDDGVNGAEPWRSDGTAAGTSLLADLEPGGGRLLPRRLSHGRLARPVRRLDHGGRASSSSRPTAPPPARPSSTTSSRAARAAAPR